MTDRPYCLHAARTIVSVHNASVRLSCSMASQTTNDLEFVWVRKSASTFKLLGKGGNNGANSYPLPDLIDLVPTLDTKDISNSISASSARDTSHGKRSRISIDTTVKNYATKSNMYTQSNTNSKTRYLFADTILVTDATILKGRILPDDPNISVIDVNVSEASNVFCYARNVEGRSKVPCVYNINVVGE